MRRVSPNLLLVAALVAIVLWAVCSDPDDDPLEAASRPVPGCGTQMVPGTERIWLTPWDGRKGVLHERR